MSLIKLWAISCLFMFVFLNPSFSADFNGDGTDDVAVFRPAKGLWILRGISRFYFGQNNDVPTIGDYNGDGTSEITVFRPQQKLWVARGLTRIYFGEEGDIPLTSGGISYNPSQFFVDPVTGNVGIGNSDPSVSFEVGQSNQGKDVIFHKTYQDGIGRLQWYGENASLRVGEYPTEGTWNNPPGNCSGSIGYNSKADGYCSVTLGNHSYTSGLAAFAAGYYAYAMADSSIAMGNTARSNNPNSIAIGEAVFAGADHAIIIGKGDINYPQDFANNIPDSLMVGFNTTTDPALFVDEVGVGCGIVEPERKLHVKDVMRLEPRDSAPSNPSRGDLYYDSTDDKLKCYNGSDWQDCF